MIRSYLSYRSIHYILVFSPVSDGGIIRSGNGYANRQDKNYPIRWFERIDERLIVGLVRVGSLVVMHSKSITQ